MMTEAIRTSATVNPRASVSLLWMCMLMVNRDAAREGNGDGHRRVVHRVLNRVAAGGCRGPEIVEDHAGCRAGHSDAVLEGEPAATVRAWPGPHGAGAASGEELHLGDALLHAHRRVLRDRDGPPSVEDCRQLLSASLQGRRAPVGDERRRAHGGDDADHGDQNEELREIEAPTVVP